MFAVIYRIALFELRTKSREIRLESKVNSPQICTNSDGSATQIGSQTSTVISSTVRRQDGTS